jgi:hypothetical protein
MSTLNRAIQGLHNNKKGLQPRIRRVLLVILVYLIWEERNRQIFNNTAKSVEVIFRKFQILFYTILYFHEKNHLAYGVVSWNELLGISGSGMGVHVSAWSLRLCMGALMMGCYYFWLVVCNFVLPILGAFFSY